METRTIKPFTNVVLLLCLCLLAVDSQKPVIKKIADGNNTNNPFYDDERQVLLFCDLIRNTTNAVDPITKKLYSITTRQQPTFILPINGTSFQYILSQDRDLVVLNWNYTAGAGTSYSTCLVVTVDNCCPGNLWTSGFAGGSGRVIGGTNGPPSPQGLPPGRGSLFVVDTTQRGKAPVSVKLTNQTITRSLAFTINNTVGFLSNGSDSVFQFSYDPRTGDLSNLKAVFDFTKNNISCSPGGLAVDSSDNLWVAGFGCGQVFKFNLKTNRIDQTVNIPQAPFLTNLIFGGRNEDELFVTSFRRPANTTSRDAGGVFRITNLGVKAFRDNVVVMKSDCTPVYPLRS